MSDFPSLNQLRRMTVSELQKVADELRRFVLEKTSEKRGHIQSSLTVTELTVALHHVFQTPEDVLIWDVGHQAYVHKVLTDRADQFHTNRQRGGLSGFPKREESEFDAFGTGHSSTSISAAVGMWHEAVRQGVNRKHVAVIGDGALTGGMAFEALNYLGSVGGDVLIVLNDNRQAIDPNVGALHDLDSYEMYFQSLGIRWMGHVDGTNMDDLVARLRESQAVDGPRVLHVETRVEVLPSVEPEYKAEHPFQEVFGLAVEELLERLPELTVISPAMMSGAGLAQASRKYPKRVIDVGIAEQHAATMAAGIAASGGRPLLHLYSTFAQRAYDQIIHDIALQNLPVTMALDRAGLVGEDGPTHHGAFDLAFLRAIPNLVIAAPRNGIELRNVLFTALNHNGPFVLRYPRDTESRFDAQGQFDQLTIGKAEWLHRGRRVCIMATGTMSRRADQVAQALHSEGIEAGALHHLFVSPLDEQALTDALEYHHWIVLEDGSRGGLHAAISEFAAGRHQRPLVHSVCLPNQFVEHGSISELQRELGMDEGSVKSLVLELLNRP